MPMIQVALGGPVSNEEPLESRDEFLLLKAEFGNCPVW